MSKRQQGRPPGKEIGGLGSGETSKETPSRLKSMPSYGRIVYETSTFGPGSQQLRIRGGAR